MSLKFCFKENILVTYADELFHHLMHMRTPFVNSSSSHTNRFNSKLIEPFVPPQECHSLNLNFPQLFLTHPFSTDGIGRKGN